MRRALSVFSLILLFVSAGILSACTRSTTASPSPGAPDTKPISKGDNQVKTATGLVYEDVVVGSGPAAKSGDMVVVHYTGYLTDGSKFDSSVDRDKPFEFHLGQSQVIRGWDEGVPGMQVGGKRELTIPPDLGYGSNGAGGVIPPNSILIFDVELLGIKEGKS